jgi:hypothetical protein
MTKTAYFEMCEALNSAPVDSEVPVDFEDLYVDVQEAMGIYVKLRDEWDTMNGNYLGKNYAGILDIFSILEVPAEDTKTMFDLIGIIDRHRSKSIADSKPKTSK